MSGPERVLVTGATGFLGSHLAYSLLRDGHQVVALARASETQSAGERLVDALGRVPADPAEASEVLGRLQTVDGDIAAPNAGLDRRTRRALADGIDEVWHSAASLSFIEEHRREIFRMNVDGTRNIVDLTSLTRSKRLQHVSTAYVAGMRSDTVRESELDVGQEFRNPYEESKCRAETMIRQDHMDGRIVATVHRPSVVIGESQTGRATHLHGVYAFIRGLWSVVDRTRKKTGKEVVELPLRIRGSKDETLNFVPIDYVTAAMRHVGSMEGSAGQTYHMANPEATSNRHWLGIVCEQLGVCGIELVGSDAFDKQPMTRLETIFHRQMAFYYRYLTGEPRFDCSKTLGALESTGIACPRVTEEFSRRMTGWYVDRLNSAGASD